MTRCPKCFMILAANVAACHVCGTRISAGSSNTKPSEDVVEVMPPTSKATNAADVELENGLSKLARFVREPSLKAMCVRGAAVIEKGHPTERAADAVADIVELAHSEPGRRIIGQFVSIAKTYLETK